MASTQELIAAVKRSSTNGAKKTTKKRAKKTTKKRAKKTTKKRAKKTTKRAKSSRRGGNLAALDTAIDTVNEARRKLMSAGVSLYPKAGRR